MSFTSPKTLPQVHGDFYAMGATLSEEDQDLLCMVRDFLEAEVSPIITEYWIREEFPHQLLPKLAELHIMGLAYQTLLTRIDMETTLIGLVLHVLASSPFACQAHAPCVPGTRRPNAEGHK